MKKYLLIITSTLMMAGIQSCEKEMEDGPDQTTLENSLCGKWWGNSGSTQNSLSSAFGMEFKQDQTLVLNNGTFTAPIQIGKGSWFVHMPDSLYSFFEMGSKKFSLAAKLVSSTRSIDGIYMDQADSSIVHFSISKKE